MSAAQLQVLVSTTLAGRLRDGCIADALYEVAHLAGAELRLVTVTPEEAPWKNGSQAGGWGVRADGAAAQAPIMYRQETFGLVTCTPGRTPEGGDEGNDRVGRAARAIACTLEHLLEREMAVADLAEEMLTGYDELNMLYTLLPNIATRVHAGDVGEVLVDETMRTLRCRRVSLLTLERSGRSLGVLASRGLPPDVCGLTIPLVPDVGGRAAEKENALGGGQGCARMDLLALSGGECHSDTFAVIRAPLVARGEPLGLLVAAERASGGEFTARDRKLLDGLAATGASALLGCRLHQAINQQMISTIRALASAIDAKDRYTHAHSARVAHLCVATAREMGIQDPEALREVELCGLLHDIGKIGVPDAILSKPCGLTPEEFVMVQRHAEIGARIVEHVGGLERVAQAVRHHHERYDGLGYPSGSSGESIPFLARLIAVPDVYDVLTSDRPYRTRIPPQNALQEIVKCKGSQLDPVIVEAFQRVIERETGGDGHFTPTADTPSDATGRCVPAATPL